MIEVTCECCGQTRIEPDPNPPRTREEMATFARWWDAEYERRNK